MECLSKFHILIHFLQYNFTVFSIEVPCFTVALIPKCFIDFVVAAAHFVQVPG